MRKESAIKQKRKLLYEHRVVSAHTGRTPRTLRARIMRTGFKVNFTHHDNQPIIDAEGIA